MLLSFLFIELSFCLLPWPPSLLPFDLLFFVVVAPIWCVVESKTEGNIRSGLFPGFWNWDSQSDEQDSPLVSPLDFHVAAMSQHPHWHQVQSYVFQASVNTFRCGNTKSLGSTCTYSLHKRKSIMAKGQNDSVFININIYWGWQPTDCYMHFLGKLEDLYGSSFSTL